MRTSGSRAERTENAQPARGPAATRRKTPSGGSAVPPPLTAGTLRAAQRATGNAAAAEGDRAAARPLFAFLDEIRAVLGSTAADKKALHNMPANLETGPASDIGRGDPGSGSDFDYTPGGAMTPRSNELKEALNLAKEPTVDWQALANRPREARRLHAEQYGGVVLSPPAAEKWEKWATSGRRPSPEVFPAGAGRLPRPVRVAPPAPQASRACARYGPNSPSRTSRPSLRYSWATAVTTCRMVSGSPDSAAR